MKILFDKSWSEGERDSAIQKCLVECKNLKMEWAIRRNDKWRRPLFASRELLSYISYLNRKDQSNYYLNRWGKYINPRIRAVSDRLPVRMLLTNWLFNALLKSIEKLAPPDKNIIQYLENNRPDVIVASPTNHRFSEEIEFVKAARVLGIPTVIQALSWDNLTTKGLTHLVPDVMLVWNKTQIDEAVRIHNIPEWKLVITGSANFDKWFNTSNLKISREALCDKAGLEVESPFIVYLGSSGRITRDESWLITDLVRAMRKSGNPDVRRMNILIRAHPANIKHLENLNEKGVVLWPRKWALPDTEEDLSDFYNSLHHCVGTVGINTSAMIDSVLEDKPTVTLITERYSKTQMETTHYGYLFKSGTLEVSYGIDECVGVIERMLNGDDSKQEARRRFMKDFIRPINIGKPVGQFAAKAIEMVALGHSAAEIQKSF